MSQLPSTTNADHGKPNRLIHETSPYLLQHAYNPVDWHPWGEEAFERARRENKPVFLSVGYSSCHWCHVMERESFEREDVAAILNEHFISVKVDREERPDIDAIYMNATQLMTGHGGWPNSVWLMPDRRPWFAGTYFPREDSYGRPGFKTILIRLAQLWKERPADVEEQAKQLADAIRRVSAGTGGPAPDVLAAWSDVLNQAMAQLRRNYDSRHGGFGGAPKFPPHAVLRWLLHEYRSSQDPATLSMITGTLDAMALGGIHDHVGGGFHRYATDERWFLPHFEKMLYDNALLARIYAEAFVVTGEARYRDTAVDTLDWTLREMRGPQGGFYSALDADSEGHEGKFYVWLRDEIMDVLGQEDGELFCRIYGVEQQGNFLEEATRRRTGANVLFLSQPIEDPARAQRMKACRARLLDVRAKRVWPALDDKVITSWNGLLIGSLAYAGRHLEQPDYVDAAKDAANFLLATLRQDGRLLRTYRDGKARWMAYLDDYAFLADGLLDLHDATGESRWLDEAAVLMAALNEHFYDEQAGGYFFTADDHEELIVRTKDPFDQAVPSGNGAAARVLLRLAQAKGGNDFAERAQHCMQAFLPLIQRAPSGAAGFLLAAAMQLDTQETSPVTVTASLSKDKAAPGDVIELTVQMSIAEGWHINSARPFSKTLVPTSVKINDSPEVSPGQAKYPEGITKTLGAFPEPMSVYEGELELKIPLSIRPDAKPGETQVEAVVNFQPCDDARCLLPETRRATLRLLLGPRS